jgi:hypothetical protein
VIGGVFVGFVFAAAAALGLQIGSAVGAVLDAVTVRDSDEPDAITRTRMRELIWTFAVLASVAVFVAFATDAAARLVWESRDVAAGLGLLVLTALVTFLVGAVGVVAILRRERPTYARLRRDLRDRSTFTVTTDELADFDARLARADEIRRRRRPARWAIRIIGVVIVATVGVFTGVILAVEGSGLAWVFLGGVVAEVIAVVVDVRAGAVHRARLDAVLEAQRQEVVAMLERARIPQRGNVPGLRDRVSRALAILREKQR